MLPLPTSPEGSPPQYVRRFARHRCSRAMQVRLRRGNEEVLLKGRCTVISEGGFEALVSGEVPLGRMVTIEFYLDGVSDPISTLSPRGQPPRFFFWFSVHRAQQPATQ